MEEIDRMDGMKMDRTEGRCRIDYMDGMDKMERTEG